MSKPEELESLQRVGFACLAPDAECVMLAGTFNDWDQNTTPMHRNDEGVWNVELELAPGRYEFKYLIDGQWSIKPRETPDCVCNPFGTLNHVLIVEPSPVEME